MPKYRTVHEVLYLSIMAGASFGYLENSLGYIGMPIGLSVFRSTFLTGIHTGLSAIGGMILVCIKFGILNDKWYWYPFMLMVPAKLHAVYDIAAFAECDAYPWYPSVGRATQALST